MIKCTVYTVCIRFPLSYQHYFKHNNGYLQPVLHLSLFKVTSLKFEKGSLEATLKHREETIKLLKRSSTKKGESLERFQQKLGLIRVAMTKEVEKV